jgi:hypothetical protein
MWAHLTDRVFPSGKSRDCATVRIEATPLGWRVTLTDLSIGYKISAESETLYSIWDGLEAALAADKAPWTPVAYGEAAQERRARERSRLEGTKNDLTGRPV